MKGIFEEIAFELNNEKDIIYLPSKAEDINGIKREDLDANDDTRILLLRDGKWCDEMYRTMLVEYKAMLYKWYK